MVEKMKRKKGISLVVLIITIAVALIIFSAIIVQVSSSMDNADTVAFAEDLTIVQDAVNMYYLQNDEIPYIDPEEAMSQNVVSNIVDNSKRSIFLEELNLNGDKNDNGNLGAFYTVDLGKLNIEKTVRGTNADNNPRDVYVVSFPSMNIYYLEGLDVRKTTYFSLSEKIIKYRKNVTPTTDNSTTDIQSSGTISVSKQKKGWSNKMGINLKAYLNAGEELYMNVQDGQDLKITTTVGNNVFFFDGITDIINGKHNITVSGLTSTDASRLVNAAVANRHIDIKKKSGTSVIDTVRIDLSGYDTAAPQVVGNNFSLNSSGDDKNVLTSTVKDEDGGSGIKEVRYEFIKKYDSTGAIVNYYTNVTNLDDAFIKARGKKATVSKEGLVEITLPKDIAAIQVLVVDNAGNWYKTSTVSTESPIYIGIEPRSITKIGSTFKLIFNSPKGIYYYSILLSRDGKSYSGYGFTPNITTTTYVKNITNYRTSYSIEDKVYVKVTATDNNPVTASRKTTTRIVSFTLADTKPDVLGEGTRYKSECAYDKPYVPENFSYVEGSVKTGYVIQDDETGSEFVWVPVKSDDEYKRYLLTSSSGFTSINPTAYVDSPGENQRTNIVKYGGFYMGRYEASPGKVTYNSYFTYPLSIKGATPYAIRGDINGALALGNNVYSGRSDIQSTLVTSHMWDITMKWFYDTSTKINKNIGYINTISSSGYTSLSIGNYTPQGGVVDGTLRPTGYSTTWCINNIYDMAGNSYEWTTETMADNSDSIILRGGSYLKNGVIAMGARKDYAKNVSLSGFGFRFAIYIK